MGINSHVLPGDFVVTIDAVSLSPLHPEELPQTLYGHAAFAASGLHTVKIKANVACLVVSVAPAGSRRKGHIFFVASTCGRIGWLWNHDVRPLVTQREPQAYVDHTYSLWNSSFSRASSSSGGCDGRSTPT